MLPLRIWTPGGTQIHLEPGKLGAVQVARVAAGSRFAVDGSVYLYGWWWIFAIVWALPVVAAVWVAVRDGMKEAFEAAGSEPSFPDDPGAQPDPVQSPSTTSAGQHEHATSQHALSRPASAGVTALARQVDEAFAEVMDDLDDLVALFADTPG